MTQQRAYQDFFLDFRNYDADAATYEISMPPSAEYGSPAPCRVTLDWAALEEPLRDLEFKNIFFSDLVRLGEVLAGCLLPVGSEMRGLFLAAVRSAGLDEGVRLRLHIQDSGPLHQIPWEFAYLPLQEGDAAPARAHFLCLNQKVSIVRHIPLLGRAPDLTPADPTRLMVAAVTASPSVTGLGPLNIRKEQGILEQIFAKFKPEGVDVKLNVYARASREELNGGLLSKPEIFHFSGHGLFEEGDEVARLVLHDRERRSQPDFLSAADLASALQGAGVRLAFLGACDSSRVRGSSPWSGVAPALVRAGVPAVLAMQYQVVDAAAIEFGRAFYAALLAGWTVDEAVSAGRRAVAEISSEDEVEWGVPTLYLRAMKGVLFSPEAVGGRRPLLPKVPAPKFEEGALVGRAEDLRQLVESLSAGRKFFVRGEFGVGKTRLSSEAFNRLAEQGQFPGGYLWLSAAGLNAPAVLESLAEALEAPEVKQAPGLPEKKNALRKALSTRAGLLIGVDDVDPATARDLLEAAPNCAVILTGSEGDLAGLATERDLPPLAPQEALELFARLAEMDLPTLPAKERERLEAILAGLGYLPLAVRLAARRYQEERSLESLEEVLRVIPDVFIAQDERLSALFDAAYQQTRADEPALRLWLRLASYPAFSAVEKDLRQGFHPADYLGARETLLRRGLADAGPNSTLVLHPLIGRGLRRVERQAVEKEQRSTYQALEQFAAEHADDFAALDLRRANLLALLDHYTREADWNRLAALLRSLFNYLRVRGLWQAPFDSLEALIEHADELKDPFDRAWARLQRGVIATLRSQLERAQQDLQTAHQMFAGQGNSAYQGVALYRQAAVAHLRGDLPAAADMLTQAISLMSGAAARGESTAVDLAGAHERMGSIAMAQGDLETARAHLVLALQTPDPETRGRAHQRMGELEMVAGSAETAGEHFRKALELAGQVGSNLQWADVELQMGYMYRNQGRYTDAQVAFRGAQQVYESLGVPLGQALARHALGSLALAREELDEAAAQFRAAVQAAEAAGLGRSAAYSRYQLGVALARQGDVEAAERLYNGALEEAARMQDHLLKTAATVQLGILAFRQGRKEDAWRLLNQVREQAARLTDHQSQAVAAYYQGLLQAQSGNLEEARQSLALAQSAFTALGSVKAGAVHEALTALEAEASLPEDAQSEALLARLASRLDYDLFSVSFHKGADDLNLLARLEGAGIRSIRALWERATAPGGIYRLAEKTGLVPPVVQQVVQLLSFYLLDGMTDGWAAALPDAGVASLERLARQDPESLLELLTLAAGDQKIAPPSLEQVRAWVEQARRLARSLDIDVDRAR